MKQQKDSSKKMIGREADAWSEKLWEGILESIYKSKSEREIRKFLENILSPAEKKTLLRRLAVLALIRSGRSYREIGEILWISPQTISAIKKSFSRQSGQYRSHYSIKSKKDVKLFEDTDESPAVDFILKFLSIPVKVFGAFFTKGMGVLGDRDFDSHFDR